MARAPGKVPGKHRGQHHRLFYGFQRTKVTGAGDVFGRFLLMAGITFSL